jgi:2-polyprenyl-6-methoxyphenol hydroxylase-like FAD-dependent oxidoreductase
MNPVTNIEALAETYDLVVVGAGPAGLSAAARAAELGLAVLLMSTRTPHRAARSIARSRLAGRRPLHSRRGLLAGAAIVARLERSAVSYAARCTVWSIAPYDDDMRGAAFEIGLSLDGRAR